MKRFNPKVSIVIPVYNGSNYLSEAIDSALAQTYKNIEILVINDGSNDNGATEKIAKSYDKKIRYFKKENGGVASALNLGIEKMNGEYFSWLSHDDMYYPEKIKKQIKSLKGQKDRNIVIFTDYEYINEKGGLLEKINIRDRVFTLDGRYIFLKKLINGLTLLVPKKAFGQEGVFNINKKYTQDYDMWYRLLKIYKFKYLEHCGSRTRLHNKQDSQGSKSQKEADDFWLSIIKNYDDSIFKELFPNKTDFLVEAYNSLIYSDHEKTKTYLKNLLSRTQNMNLVTENLIYTKKELEDRVSIKWQYLAISLFFMGLILLISIFLFLAFMR